ncbi:MAG TPA: hypothetical protein VNO21_11720 [Polyangiaceae bacterium]|nr:hypothetical protein [Polyangiaceae bacterium]
MKRALLLFSASLIASFAAMACGGSDTAPTPGDPSARGPGDGQPQTNTNPGNDVAVTDAVTRVEFGQAWLGAASTPGKCEEHYVGMTYERTTHAATWHECQGGNVVDAARTLTQDEASRVEASLAAITYVNHPPCAGYDGLSVTMTTVRADGTSQQFVKENINCYDFPAAPKLGDAFSLLLALR